MNGVSIFELTATSCRWALGERPSIRFCGAECPPEAPYCNLHMRMAYQDEPGRRKTRNLLKPHSAMTGSYR